MKRTIISVVTIIGFLTAPLFVVPAASAAPTVLKVSHFVPPDHSIHKDLVRWGEELEKKSNGQLKLDITPAAKLAPPDKQYDLVQSGNVDIAVSLHAYTPGKFPMTEIVQLPFVVRSTAAAGSVRLSQLAPKYLQQEHIGTKLLFMITSSTAKIHLTKKRVTSIDDFKGLRIRATGLQSETVKALGAVPVSIPITKAFDAMKNGEVDGGLFPYEAAVSYNIDSVTKYILEPGFNVLTFFVAMNQQSYDRLPPPLRKIVDETTGPQLAQRFGAHTDEQEELGKAKMLSRGVEIIVLPRAARSRIEAVTERYSGKVLSGLAKSGMPSFKFYLDMLTTQATAQNEAR